MPSGFTFTVLNAMRTMYTRSPLLIATLLLLLAATALPDEKAQTPSSPACSSPSLKVSAAPGTGSPYAVGVDDFNNDGKPDVVTAAHNVNGPVTLYLGDGSGGLSTPNTTSVSQSPTSVAIADFNGDGNKDVFVGTEVSSQKLLLGNGTGGFAPARSTSLFFNSITAAAGDMNGDGKADVVLLGSPTTGPEMTSVFVLLGDGAGNFQVTGSSVNVGAFSSSIKVIDINGDTKLDVLVSSGGLVFILLGNGTGQLSSGGSVGFGTFITSLVVDDFNSDSKLDLAASREGSEVVTCFGDGAGNFTAPVVGASNQGSANLVKGDFNGDGKRDLLAYTLSRGTVTVLLNDGAAHFTPASNFFVLAGNGVKVDATSADMNLDGRPDFILGVQFFGLRVMTSSCDFVPGTTQLSSSTLFGFENLGGPSPPPGVAAISVFRVGDVTGSSTVDYSTSPGTALTPQDFTHVSGTLSFNEGETTKSVTVPIIDDNITEPTETFTFTLSNATGTSSLGTPASGTVFITDNEIPPAISINDIAITEGDGGTVSATFDVTLSNPSASQVSLSFQSVNGSATAGSDYTSVSEALTFAPGETRKTISVQVNGDVAPEPSENFFVNLSSPENATILDGQGQAIIRDDDSSCPNPSYTLGQPLTVAPSANQFVTGDFNSDTKLDVISLGGIGRISFLAGNGDGTFAPAVDTEVGGGARTLVKADFNLDGKLDLVVTRPHVTSELVILTGDGAGGFSLRTVSGPSTSITAAVAADLNNDTKPDLAVTCFLGSNPTLAVLLGNGNGTFANAVSYIISDQSADVIAVDLNGDNKLDFVTANPVNGQLSILLNNGDGTFGTTTNLPMSENPHAVAAGDVNSDGKPDLVVTRSNSISVLFGNGSGSFTAGTDLPGIHADNTVLTDLNSDGRLDLAAGDQGPNANGPFSLAVAFGSGNGSFGPVVRFTLPVSPGSIVAGNFNGGSNPELIFSHRNGTSIGVALNSCSTIAPGPSVQFNATSLTANEGSNAITFQVVRSGNTQPSVSVDYATSDSGSGQNCAQTNGNASSRCDYLRTLGRLTFAPNETVKTVSLSIVDDAYAEGNETFQVVLSNLTGAVLGSPSTLPIVIVDNETTTQPNPITNAEFFVRQHYRDFLNREPDQNGLNFWIGNFTECAGDQQCIDVKRVNVSAAFFLSIEFQQTGYLVERLYKVAYGDRTATSTLGGTHQVTVPIVRFDEFLADTQNIGLGIVVGATNWEQNLENNKQLFAQEFVGRSRFTTTFPTSLTADQFVDQLNANAGGPLTQQARDQLVSQLSGGQLNRGQVVRAIAENQTLTNAEFNRAFVLMQYFGYMRRNPDDSPDSDFTGYDFWLSKLNQFNGNFANAEMVKAFILSDEYRRRFGP